ncbi:hypothetical protein LZF95_10580 [Algoriphagus sp. AGSA1]|uniref:hypothetical protein n=1 Tax=Algoriphagus sp. AGSA1 TaxID=2907213 RepID=UPI001F38BFE0|nr:hypothetical protein [Algoriphagus sp. AGSA1]MCE7055121.1 hypothetical protein [Algoriphagus sp. AGSA1]
MILCFHRYKGGLPVLFVLFLLFSHDSTSQDITGHWRWFKQDRAFTIFLYKPKSDDELLGSYDLIGKHCGQYYNGGRIDCAEQLSVFLKKERDNIFTGTIKSAYSDGISEIRILYSPKTNQINWQVIKGVGQFYFPHDAILEK